MNNFPRSVFRFYVKNFWRYRGVFLFLFCILSIIDSVGLHLLPPFFLKKIVAILGDTPAAAVLSAILPVALVYFCFGIIWWSTAISRWAVFDNAFRYKTYNKMSSDLYQYVFRQSAQYYSNSMPGKIASQINNIVDAYIALMVILFGNTLAAIATIMIAGVGLVQIGWQYLCLIMLATVGRVAWGALIVRKSLRTAADRAAAQNTMHGKLLDSLSNFMVVKLFARASAEQEMVWPTRHRYEMAARRAHFWSRVFWAPGNLFSDTICFSALIVLCGYMYSTGQSSIADISFSLAVYGAISSMAFHLILEMRDIIDTWGNAVGSYQKLIQPISVADAPDATVLRVTRGDIELRNLKFKYNKKLVLDNLSLNIRAGEKVGLVGVSGAGKTTLVNLLMRLYDVQGGEIYIDGQDISRVTQDSLRENISFIPQEPTMFNRTLWENIAYGRIGATDADVRRAARYASADKFIRDASDKYQTLVGDRGVKLSGGQRQRIAIARAFLKDAPILILDEATAALDSETESVIQESFEKLSHGRTTIVIAHRLSTLRNMDRIVVLDHGKIAEVGNHKSLMRKKDGIYARLWKMQSGGFIQD